MLTLNDILKFIKLTHKFQQVKRAILVKGEDRHENDLEHSYQLAVLAWYIVSANNLKLNLSKVIKYALVHDIVEAYAGDTNYYKQDKELKRKLEHKALLRLKKEFPKFTELPKLIAAYEVKKDKESKFVYALDKFIPSLNVYLDKGRSWHADGITLQMHIDYKTKPISISPEVAKYFIQMVKLLKKHKHYFLKS